MSEDKVPESLNKSEFAEALFEELSEQNVTKKLAMQQWTAFNAESGIIVGHLEGFKKKRGDVDQRVGPFLVSEPSRFHTASLAMAFIQKLARSLRSMQHML